MRRALAGLVGMLLIALGFGASEARATGSDQVTITMLNLGSTQPGFQLLIANFERVYPNIKVETTYAPGTVLSQLMLTELAGGNAPDLLGTFPGCGSPTSVCGLAKAGYLAPLVSEPWTRWSLPLVTSLGKYGPGLYAFEPSLNPYGMMTNDALFAKLGLRVPQTFSQLLAVCRAAKTAGTIPVLFNGGGVGSQFMINDLAVATVYGRDPHFNAKLKAGTVSFARSPGWHQALQRFLELNQAGCFDPGVAGVINPPLGQFAQGGGLMLVTNSSNKGVIDTYDPQFPYSFHPFPGGTVPGQTETLIQLDRSLSVNAHSSPDKQAAARTFIDFVARPAQNALYTKVNGSLTQREFLTQELPGFMQPMAPVFAAHAYAINPIVTWWNPNVGLVLQQDGVGLLTGQLTVDQLLQAMDDAWKQGPA
jgi:raffinose/stachyose/melibiose transport system substrate-binding protein